MLKKNRLAALLLAPCLCLSLAACSGGNSAATPAPADTEPVETIGGADGPTDILLTEEESDVAYIQERARW